ncbi:MAG: hypothetical protein SAL70_44435 [Scytonema sp. PMC 1070.18]|nr:hypothetical protein [Scytonema sp. PMC 1070.18]
MPQYLHHLLVVILVISGTAIAIKSPAQNLKESDSETTKNNVILTSSQPSAAKDTTGKTNSGDFGNLTDSQPAFASESENNPSPTNPKKAAAKSTIRIPVSSRIFSAPSMQQ